MSRIAEAASERGRAFGFLRANVQWVARFRRVVGKPALGLLQGCPSSAPRGKRACHARVVTAYPNSDAPRRAGAFDLA
jgi:hypothetical protein